MEVPDSEITQPGARVEYLAYIFFVKFGDFSPSQWHVRMIYCSTYRKQIRVIRPRPNLDSRDVILGFEDFIDRYGTFPTEGECFVAWIKDVSHPMFNSIVCVKCGNGPLRGVSGCQCKEARYAFCIQKSNIKSFLTTVGRPCLALEKTLDGHTAASPAIGEGLLRELSTLYASHEARHPQCPYKHIPLPTTPHPMCDTCRKFPCRLSQSGFCLIWRCHGAHNWDMTGCDCEHIEKPIESVEAPPSEVPKETVSEIPQIVEKKNKPKMLVKDIIIPEDYICNTNLYIPCGATEESTPKEGLWNHMTKYSIELFPSLRLMSPTSPPRYKCDTTGCRPSV